MKIWKFRASKCYGSSQKGDQIAQEGSRQEEEENESRN